MSRRPFFKFYFRDFADGCRKAKMTPEQVGMYIMSLGYIWEDEGFIPSDMSILGVRTGWGKRLCTRLVGNLREIGKLVETEDGRLTNDRMVREIEAFVQIKKAAQNREAKRKIDHLQSDYSPTIEQLKTDYRETLDDLKYKKTNENNEGKITDEARHGHIPQKSEVRSQIFTEGSVEPSVKNNNSFSPRARSARVGFGKGKRDFIRRDLLPADPPDGTLGLLFADGKLSIVEGLAVSLRSEFEGIDLEAVCNKAASKILLVQGRERRNLSHLECLGIVREQAQYDRDYRRKQSASASPKFGGKRNLLAGLSPEQRAAAEAALAARRGAN